MLSLQELFNPLKKLEGVVYCLEYHPSWRSPYVIRLVGRGKRELDLKNYIKGTTEDVLCGGKTLKETVEKALIEIQDRKATP